jgi:hypothetical protein
MNQSNAAIEAAAQDYRDQQLADYLDDYDAPVEGVFNECSPLDDIYQALVMEHEVTFQASWSFGPTIYTAFDILLDHIKDNVDTTELAASIFAAALFNKDKGAAATDLAQDCDFKSWVFDFFKYLQTHVSYMAVPNFSNIKGA